ncbi:MAG TPA: SPW repeat protein [Xanthobacteraceae bacterium]|jgi:hypothetical protein|nr:SPW repeat protein [Xanthobacteraceae bacterium]
MADRSSAQISFNIPEQWEDWVNWLLGIWLCISPWALRFFLEPLSTRNAVVVGFLIIVSEVVTLSIFRPWEEWINILLGVWLVISPWVLESNMSATLNFMIVGILVASLAFYERRQANRAQS